MADINVTVTVDTQNINSGNLQTTVVLTDDHGDSDDTPGDSETFDIHATQGQTIGFTIVALGDIGTVSLVSFAQESGVAAFSDLPSSGNGFVGTVSSTITGSEQFGITFLSNGTQYTLDPILKADQG
ncbi:MAG: hypothetical protein RIC35_08920 [Marinoscillum sp.]